MGLEEKLRCSTAESYERVIDLGLHNLDVALLKIPYFFLYGELINTRSGEKKKS